MEMTKIPLVATKEDLEEEIHMLLGSACDHGRIAPHCMVVAVGLMASKTMQTVPEFMKKLGDHDEVRAILMDAMAEAWHEGYLDGYNDLGTGAKNPYKVEK